MYVYDIIYSTVLRYNKNRLKIKCNFVLCFYGLIDDNLNCFQFDIIENYCYKSRSINYKIQDSYL